MIRKRFLKIESQSMTDPKKIRFLEADRIRKTALNILSELKSLVIQFFEKIRENEKLGTVLRKIYMSAIFSAAIAFLIIFLLWIVPLAQELCCGRVASPPAASEVKEDPSYQKTIARIRTDTERLERRYNSYTTGQSYLVINTTDNIFHLYRNKKEIRTGPCSSGSYKMLQTHEGRSWIFKTPKGRFRIRAKTVNPVWTRPDWAFVEEGLPIPAHNHPSRYEHGVLGKYSLSLGDGYLIHGTIYKRLIGMPVTHGCVRLGDEDLEVIFRTLNIGSKVYIF